MIETLKIAMIILLFAAATIISLRFAMWFCWYCEKNKACPHVSYKNFREFYAVAPDKWKIKNDYLEYENGVVELEKYSDLLKCRRFKRQLKKRSGELERSARQAAFLGKVQKDINRYRDQAVEEAAAALKHIQGEK